MSNEYGNLDNLYNIYNIEFYYIKLKNITEKSYIPKKNETQIKKKLVITIH